MNGKRAKAIRRAAKDFSSKPNADYIKKHTGNRKFVSGLTEEGKPVFSVIKMFTWSLDRRTTKGYYRHLKNIIKKSFN